MAVRGTEGQQSSQASHCSLHTAEQEWKTAAVRLDAVEVDCTLLLEAQTGAGLQMTEGSEVHLRTKGGFAAEGAWIQLCCYAVRLAGH